MLPAAVQLYRVVGVRSAIKHVVVFVQENHTTDNYFSSMRAWGANVASGWPTTANPPTRDQPHDRRAYARWLSAAERGEPTPATHSQFDTAAVLPYYAYLAATGAFLENHCSGFGTNSTPNHLLIVGGQSPTLRNPPRGQSPVWDMPSVLGHVGDHQMTWKAYTGRSGYPVSFYAQLAGSPNVIKRGDLSADAADLPTLSMVWHDSPFDEHPPADVTQGQDAVWRAVDAVVRAGHWDDTVFLLTWDDWGGWDDHVSTPNLEHTPDGVQLAYGPRVPLLMFGGRVAAGVDSRWSSHVSIGRTVLDLLGLPPLGVARLDEAVSLADLVGASPGTAPPPAYGTEVTLPPAPQPTPQPVPPPPPPAQVSVPVGPVILRGGSVLPPPNDQPVTAAVQGRHPLQLVVAVPTTTDGHVDGALAPAWPTFRGNAQRVGASTNGTVTVYVDPNLGIEGHANAAALLADADRIVGANNTVFNDPGGPVSVVIYALGGATDGTGGADHGGCTYQDGSAIEVCAAFGNPEMVSALFEAELSECSMGGTLCGVSTGEALSRWCAAVIGHNALARFATAPGWAAAGMADYVTTTDHTDQNPDSVGCAMAFLSWLLARPTTLSELAQQMVALGGEATLAQLYARLTGEQASRAWPAFRAALDALPAGVHSDDPFGALPTLTAR